MARNQDLFRTAIRMAIREELRNLLGGAQEFDLNEVPGFDAVKRTGGPRRRSRAKTKGRVTKPTDRRLKQNREA